jgi:hypothetical protein
MRWLDRIESKNNMNIIENIEDTDAIIALGFLKKRA